MYVIKSLDLGVSVDKTTIPHIYFSDYGNANVPCVEISVQKEIAAYLNIQNDKINSSIAKQQDIIDALEEYKMALSTHATTKGIDKSNLVDSNEPWLGSIPSRWQVRRIGTLFKETNERGNDELPILTVSINDGISNKELSEDESMRNFVRSEDKSKYKHMLPGDIVYNMMRAWQGAFGAARVEGMVSPAYVTARPIIPMDSRYFEYLMRTDIAAKEFERYSRGIADFRLRLYWPEFRTIKVCVPPIAEQTQIADFLDEQYEKTAHSIQQHKNIITKLEEYRKAIIYHTINGNVDMKEVQNG
jgi:type I restriction enzyme S subunit